MGMSRDGQRTTWPASQDRPDPPRQFPFWDISVESRQSRTRRAWFKQAKALPVGTLQNLRSLHYSHKKFSNSYFYEQVLPFHLPTLPLHSYWGVWAPCGGLYWRHAPFSGGVPTIHWIVSSDLLVASLSVIWREKVFSLFLILAIPSKLPTTLLVAPADHRSSRPRSSCLSQRKSSTTSWLLRPTKSPCFAIPSTGPPPRLD